MSFAQLAAAGLHAFSLARLNQIESALHNIRATTNCQHPSPSPSALDTPRPSARSSICCADRHSKPTPLALALPPAGGRILASWPTCSLAWKPLISPPRTATLLHTLQLHIEPAAVLCDPCSATRLGLPQPALRGPLHLSRPLCNAPVSLSPALLSLCHGFIRRRSCFIGIMRRRSRME